MASGTDLPLAAISSRPIAIEPTTAARGIASAIRRRRSGRRSASAVMRPAPTCRHEGADGAALAHLGRTLAHQAAAIEHGDAVGDGDQLVELAGDQQHADAAAGGGADLAIDRLDGADVEAARRLGGDQRHQRIERQLASPARPSAGCRRTGRRRRPRVQRRARRIPSSGLAPASFSAPRCSRPKRVKRSSLFRIHVLGHRHGGDAGHGMAILRHDAAARRRHRRGAGMGELGVADEVAAFGRAPAGPPAPCRARSGRCPRRRPGRRSRRPGPPA